jgi:uncharacterized protein with PIN domain
MQDKKEEKIKFFVDAMLGNIAKKMRLFGYDTEYFSDIDDQQLINIAEKEDRVIISRDENLIEKSRKNGLRHVFITKNNEIEQFQEIINCIKLDVSEISGDTARCPKCNSLTKQVDRTSIKEKVPQRIFEMNERFWQCIGCNQIYWEGTHIRNLQKFAGKINERLQ